MFAGGLIILRAGLLNWFSLFNVFIVVTDSVEVQGGATVHRGIGWGNSLLLHRLLLPASSVGSIQCCCCVQQIPVCSGWFIWFTRVGQSRPDAGWTRFSIGSSW